MKDSLNTIFIDLKLVVFPERLHILPQINNEFLDNSPISNHISNYNGDQVTVHLFNEIQKNNEFNIVLLDYWIDPSIHHKEQFDELFKLNKLNFILSDNYVTEKTDNKLSLTKVTEWMDNNPRKNYIAIVSQDIKNQIDLIDNSSVDYNKTIFVNNKNGLTIDNINDINKNINNWY